MNTRFLPEGRFLYTAENQKVCTSRRSLLRAMNDEQILEGRALLCGTEHNLIVQVGPFTGIIPREEAALGIAEGTTRDIAILSRVGKPVCFTISAVEGSERSTTLLLSRRRAQQLALEHMLSRWQPGDIILATVTHMESFGAFVDIGCGIPSMIGIENLSVSRIPHPDCRFTSGQNILALVTGIDHSLSRVTLSHKELLGTWMENAASLEAGMTVPGYVRSIKEYGMFVELFPNLSGLAEPKEGLREGDRVSVYIKSIFRDRHKIKLRILERLPPEETPPPFSYFPVSSPLYDWDYHGKSEPGSNTLPGSSSYS